MNGRPRPHRQGMGRRSPSARRNAFSLTTSLLIALLLVTLLATATLAGGCGSNDQTTTTAAPPAEETTTTAAASGPIVPGGFPVVLTDDLGVEVTIPTEPMRIVSTAPANTEMLFALGLNERIVGVTSLDDYPPEAADVAKVGDFQVNTEAVMALSPDLVVGYAGNQEALAPVQSAGAPVMILDPTTLKEIYDDILLVGTATGTAAAAAKLVESIKAEVAAVTKVTEGITESPKVFYALDNTLWTAGPGSFVDELLSLVNATNVGAMQGDSAAVQPYFQFAPEQLIAADPDVILLPNTAYTSVDEFVSDARFASLRAVKEGRVVLIDDVIITRPGPRIGQGLKTLAAAVHPGAF